MNYAPICQGILCVFAAVSLVALLKRRPDWLLWLLVFALTMGGFNWYAGTIILPVKIVSGFSLLYLLIFDRNWREAIYRSGNGAFWTLVVVVLLAVSMAFLIPTPEGMIDSSGLQGPKLRVWVQFYSYIAALSMFPLALVVFNCTERLLRFCSWYVACALLASIVAGVQLGMTATGHEFMPILRWNAEHAQMAAFGVSGALVQRVYAFAGEPKHLAVFLMPALFMVVIALSAAPQLQAQWWCRRWVALGIGLALILTYSSAAFIALFVSVIPLAFVVGRTGLGRLFKLSLVGLLLVGSAYFVNRAMRSDEVESGGRAKLTDAIRLRTVDRLQSEGEDLYAVQLLKYVWEEKKQAIFFGLGPGMFSFHVPRSFDKGVEPIDAGWAALFLDTGIAGVGALALWLLTVWMRNNESIRRSSHEMSLRVGLQTVYFAGLIAAVFMHMGIPALPLICIFAAAVESARTVESEESASQLYGSTHQPGRRPRRERHRRGRPQLVAPSGISQ